MSPSSKEYMKSYRERNKEKLRLQRLAYYKKHRQKQLEYSKNYRKKNIKKVKLSSKKWRLLNKHKLEEYSKKRYLNYSKKLRRQIRESSQRMRVKHPNQIKARSYINHALRDGRLFKAPCKICGNLKVEAHHPDYSKPEIVDWLCRSHHKAWHRIFEANI